jgi:hypothetical protein
LFLLIQMIKHVIIVLLNLENVEVLSGFWGNVMLLKGMKSVAN